MITFFFKCFRKLPLISGLYGGQYGNPSKEDYIEALKEWALVFALSFCPIVFSIIIDVSLTAENIKLPDWPQLIYQSFLKNFQHGEIFFLAIASLAPVIFILYKYSKEEKSFENILSFQISFLVIAGIGSLFFGLEKIEIIKNQFILQSFESFSVNLYIFTLFIMYLAFVYNNLLSDIKVMQKAKELGGIDRDQTEKQLAKQVEGFRPE